MQMDMISTCTHAHTEAADQADVLRRSRRRLASTVHAVAHGQRGVVEAQVGAAKTHARAHTTARNSCVVVIAHSDLTRVSHDERAQAEEVRHSPSRAALPPQQRGKPATGHAGSSAVLYSYTSSCLNLVHASNSFLDWPLFIIFDRTRFATAACARRRSPLGAEPS